MRGRERWANACLRLPSAAVVAPPAAAARVARGISAAALPAALLHAPAERGVCPALVAASIQQRRLSVQAAGAVCVCGQAAVMAIRLGCVFPVNGCLSACLLLLLATAPSSLSPPPPPCLPPQRRTRGSDGGGAARGAARCHRHPCLPARHHAQVRASPAVPSRCAFSLHQSVPVWGCAQLRLPAPQLLAPGVDSPKQPCPKPCPLPHAAAS